MSSLVIGATGQVGRLLALLSSQQGRTLGTGFTQAHAFAGLARLDLRDAEAVERLLCEVRPEVCYLPAAFTHVDGAEANPSECRAVNVEGARHVARGLKHLGGLLVFFSTDHVFGECATPRRESASTHPMGVYARSKAEAERLVAEELPDRHLILRTSWVFGPDPREKNFVYRVRRALEESAPLLVAEDQAGQPTYGPDLAATAIDLVRRQARGTFHVVGPEKLTKLQWARRIAGALGYWGQSLLGVRTNGVDAGVPRPRQVELDRRKLLAFLGHDPIRSPAAGLRCLIHQWQREPVRPAA